jgi:ADP-ribosylglycohydrolase
MQLSFSAYKDKVMGCWAGKNIGGVLGAPFECKRQYNDIDFYTQDLSDGPPPNDDLDLQIIWLSAVERFGRQVNASVLAEYWLSYVVPFWAEYGTGKSNLVAGLTPPLSGHVLNQYRNSCGCFIRSEIWACLAPGHPALAVRYAFEDAIVDHSGEGVYGEVFCAALQSAAFVESDTRKLIAIGLSYIPVDCAVARCVKEAVACYDGGVPLKKARVRIHNTAPGMFGLLGKKHIPDDPDGLATGTPGFDCPENVGFLIAGWLYGEGDFGKAICNAVACGEDTDCTAATLGAIMGIVAGASNLPEKWTKPLDDKIATLCINLTSWGGIWVPKTVTELTDRVLRVTPRFLDVNDCDILNEGYTVNCREGDGLYCPSYNCPPGLMADEWPRILPVRELVALPPTVVRYPFAYHTVMVDYGGEPFFSCENPVALKITVINNNVGLQQMWCRVKAYCPEGVRCPDDAFHLPLNSLYGDKGEAAFVFDVGEYKGSKLEILFDVSFEGRHTSTPVKAMLLRRNA